MKVLFVQKDVFAKPAFMALSALLKAEGHRVDLLVDDLEKRADDRIEKESPDMICFSITTGEFPWMKSFVQRIRRRFHGMIVCGGPHPTFYPEIIEEPWLDAICIGEGDRAFPEFVNTVAAGEDHTQVENFHVRKGGNIIKNRIRDLVKNLDSLPFYDRSLYRYYPQYREPGNDILYHTVVITGRGCPYKCSFCFNASYNELYNGKGKIVRRRSVENLILELKELVRQYSPSFITFDDDTFTLSSSEWLDRFFRQYKEEVGIPFKLNARANHLNRSLVAALRSAGCYAVKIGVESGDSDIRNRLLKKKISNHEIQNAASLLKEYKIRFQTFNIIGTPGETFDLAMETFRLNRNIQPDFVWTSLLVPYPGTEIYEYCLNQGWLEGGSAEEKTVWSYFRDTPLSMPEKERMVNLQKILYIAVLFRLPDSVVRRLTRLPLHRFYSFLFGTGMFLGLMRINRIPFLQSFMITVRYLKEYNSDAAD